MTVLYNTNFTGNPNAYLTLAIADAARGLWGEKHVLLADNRALLPAAASGEHDTLICIDGQRLNRGLIQRARESFRTTVLWLFEDPFMLDYNVENAALFDYIFTNDPSCVAAYRGKGHYLPLAASPRLHHRPVRTEDELEYDIFFAGTMWPNRVPVVRGLIAAFPDACFKLVCPTNEYLPPLPADLAERAIQRPVNHESFIDFANASRVCVTLFRDYPSHGKISQATAPGPRLYELGLAGTAQVVACPDAINVDHFRSVSGVIVARGQDSLCRAVSDLLAQPVLRARCALQSQHAVEASHLYTHRLRRMAAIAGIDAPERMPKRAVRQPRKLRILMCTHSTLQEREWGGVEVYQQTLCAMLAGQAEVFFWLRRNGSCRLIDQNGTVLERFGGKDVGWLDSLCDSFEEIAFASVLGQYDFDVVHFQHLGHHAASLPIIAKAAGLGTVFSVHDFFLACSRYDLLNHEQRFCDIGNRTISACDICLKTAEELPQGVQQTRRAFIAEMLKSIDVLLFGSAYSEHLISSIYPLLATKTRTVLGIPTPVRAPAVQPRHRPRGDSDKIVVTVLGNFIRPKGAEVVMQVMAQANPALFEFHIRGKASDKLLDALRRLDQPNIIYHGRYTPGDLDALMQADVSLHLSLWPETYCIALSEAWQAGLVPIVSDIGALGDRVTDGLDGYKVAVGDASAVLNRLELLRASPQLLETMRAAIRPRLWVDHRDYADKLLELYRSIAPRTVLGISKLHLDVGQLHLLPHASWKQLAPSRSIFDPPLASSARLDLPSGIRHWISIQGSYFQIERLCETLITDLANGSFEPSDQFEAEGWTFMPDLGVAGQIWMVLIEENGAPVIVLPAERIAREDVVRAAPNAPSSSGFLVRAALRGRWSDGLHSVALVNRVDDRAGFQLTDLRVRLFEGRVTEARIARPDKDDVLRAFTHVAAQGARDQGPSNEARDRTAATAEPAPVPAAAKENGTGGKTSPLRQPVKPPEAAARRPDGGAEPRRSGRRKTTDNA